MEPRDQKHRFRISRGMGDQFEDLGEEELTFDEAKFKAIHEEVTCQLIQDDN